MKVTMKKKKNLTKRQLAVSEDLFAGELEEQAVLDKYKVSRNTFDRWLSDQRFIEQFNNRIAQAYHQSELIIARYARLAALKLIELTESDKDETARKACLDIITRNSISPRLYAGGLNPEQSTPPVDKLSPQTASRLLAVLAEEKEQ